jgi:ATP-binding cassette subfamily B protein
VSARKKSGFRELFAIYAPYRSDVFKGLFFLFFQTSYVWLSPIFIARLIDLPGSDPETRMFRFVAYGSAMLTLILLNYPSSCMRSRFMSRLARGVSRDLRVGLCRQLQQLTLLFHGKHSVGRLQAKAIRDIDILEQLPGQFATTLFTTTITITVALVAIAIRAPRGLIFFAVLVPASVGLRWYFKERMQKTTRQYRHSFETMSAGLTDMITMMPVTRAHALESFELNRVTNRIDDVFTKGRRFDLLMNRFSTSSWVILNIFQASFLLGAVYFCFQKKITVGDVLMFNAFFASISGSILTLLNVTPMLARARESLSSINEILHAPDKEHNAGKPVVTNVDGRLTFEKVVYRYPGAEKPAINGLSLDIHAGESIAFVGPSGCGKSSMLSLALGFIRPQDGTVRLDGRDMSGLDLRGYRRNVGVVAQDVVFFSGTVLYNVAYGTNGIPRERIAEAIKLANAWDFVEKLPEGMETRLGENGVALSGGQRQRLAIARALLRDPRVLVLDEATSALDVESEMEVQAALDDIMKDRTTIVVSHRLSTVRKCDRIIILDEGQILEQGTHEDLMRTRNFYSRIMRATSLAA